MSLLLGALHGQTFSILAFPPVQPTASNSIIGEIKNEVFLKNGLFFNDPEGVNSRSARPSASCTYWLYSKERA